MAGDLPLAIDGASLDIPGLVAVARGGRRARIVDGARARMDRSRAWVEAAAASPDPIYGVSTGFGSLARVRIDPALRIGPPWRAGAPQWCSEPHRSTRRPQ